MKLDQEIQAPTEITAPAETSKLHVGRIRIPPGMKLWERTEEGQIIEVQLTRNAILTGGSKSSHTKNPTSRYCIAVNKKNAEKKFNKVVSTLK